MSQRHSEYERQPRDTYQTPQWCFDELFAVEPFHDPWDCAPVDADFDFLQIEAINARDIVTNPPFKLAHRFLWHALHHKATPRQGGDVAANGLRCCQLPEASLRGQAIQGQARAEKAYQVGESSTEAQRTKQQSRLVHLRLELCRQAANCVFAITPRSME